LLGAQALLGCRHCGLNSLLASRSTVMQRCPLLVSFLQQQSVAIVKHISLRETGHRKLANKQQHIDRIIDVITFGGRRDQVSGILEFFTADDLKIFLNNGPRHGVAIGSSKLDAISAFVERDILQEQADLTAAMAARRSTAPTDASTKAPMNASTVSTKASKKASTKVSTKASTKASTSTAEASTKASPSSAEASMIPAMLVAWEPQRRRRKQLHRCWGKLAQAQRRKTDSAKIRHALKEACAGEGANISIDNLRRKVETLSGVSLAADNRKAYTFFYKKVMEQATPKVKKRPRRRVRVVDFKKGNPLLEFKERRQMQYEDSLSSVALRS
jgi:hypothetical protein